jgi:hypothetical protein
MDDDTDLDLPRELKLALKRTQSMATPIPAAVDRAVGAAFQWERARRWRRWRWVAAAAAALFLAGMWWILDAGRQSASSARDLNADGRVDIVDAYLLALAVEAGSTELRHDIDGDGRLDGEDARMLARAVVRVAEVQR